MLEAPVVASSAPVVLRHTRMALDGICRPVVRFFTAPWGNGGGWSQEPVRVKSLPSPTHTVPHCS